jgi:hypothetical protein
MRMLLILEGELTSIQALLRTYPNQNHLNSPPHNPIQCLPKILPKVTRDPFQVVRLSRDGDEPLHKLITSLVSWDIFLRLELGS